MNSVVSIRPHHAFAATLFLRGARVSVGQAAVLAAVVLAHGGVFALVSKLAPAQRATPAATLTVELVTSAPVAAPRPRAPVPAPRQQPAARSVAAKPAPAAPSRLAANTSSATAPTAPVGEAQAAPTVAAPSSAAASPAALPAETPARFNANYLKNPAPAYPAASRRLGEEGKVVVRVLVTPDGRAGQVELAAGSGSARLDQAAQDAVGRWKFVPARRGEEAVAAWVLVPIVLSLGAS